MGMSYSGKLLYEFRYTIIILVNFDSVKPRSSSHTIIASYSWF